MTGKRRLPRLDVDPLSLSREELLRRGYPPRPDPNRAPTQYQNWLEIVAREPAIIEAHVISDATARRDRRGPVQLPSNGGQAWCGYVLQQTKVMPQFAEVFGRLEVPDALGVRVPLNPLQQPFLSPVYSSFWVGLDGFGTNSVAQDGTQTDGILFGDIQAAGSFAWYEWFPKGTQVISNFPAASGDMIDAWTWVSAQQGSTPPSKSGKPNPQGQFGAPTQWSSQGLSGTSGTWMGDVNGDHFADAVSYNADGIDVALSDGHSSFGSRTNWNNLAITGTNISGTGLGDVNGDGIADAVTFYEQFASVGGQVYVSLSTGNAFPTWATWQFGPGFPGSYGYAIADLNGDHLADAVAFDSGGTYVMLSTGTAFGPISTWAGPFVGSSRLTLADVNGDGKADAVGFAPNGYGPYVMLSTGTGFGPAQAWCGSGCYGAQGNAVGDVNADGLADLVAFNANGTTVLLSNGYNFYQTFGETWGPAFSGTQATTLADVNGDGRADAVAFNAPNSFVMLSQTASNALTPGTTAFFYLYNETRNVGTSVLSTSQPPKTTFTGTEAEWIMEWPGSETGYGVTDFGTTDMFYPLATTFDGASYSYDAPSSSGIQSTQVTMTDGSGNTLATVTPEIQTLVYTWKQLN
jgi:hypothetical protein